MHSLTDVGAKHAEVESELQFIAEQFYNGTGFSEAILQAAHEDADFPVPRVGLEYCLAVLTERGLLFEVEDQAFFPGEGTTSTERGLVAEVEQGAEDSSEGTTDEPEPFSPAESEEHLLKPV